MFALAVIDHTYVRTLPCVYLRNRLDINMIPSAQPPGDTSTGKGRGDVDAGPWVGFGRRDAWDMVWAADDPNQVW